MIIAFSLIGVVTIIVGITIIFWILESKKLSLSLGKRFLISSIIFVIVMLLVAICIKIPSNRIANLVTDEQRVTAQVVSKEASYTREKNTTTYNYCVTVECETEEGIFSATFDDIDLYESVKKGDTLEVILVIRYKNNGEIYDTTMYQIYDEE